MITGMPVERARSFGDLLSACVGNKLNGKLEKE